MVSYSTQNRFRLFLLTLLMAGFLFGCSKDSDDGGNVTPSGVAGNYKIAALRVNPALNGISDLLPFINALTGSTCMSDITLSFKANGTLTADDPASCRNVDPEETTGIENNSKWTLSGNKLTITDADGSKTEYDVTIKGQNMDLSWKEEDTDANGKPVTYTYTMEMRRV